MSGHVSRGSAGEYQADERAGDIVVYCGLVGLEDRHGTPVPCRYSDTKAFSILTTKACAIVYT